ncbi:CDP-glycerol glycerophosphotransferase family protein [Ruicaihuangia caeni]|uniref:CDP-glycerol glycerophosphotransferase family protein n=1 Tax=Ruicaihuangia caeni TaxID=3042517 RepID=UPI00338E31A2
MPLLNDAKTAVRILRNMVRSRLTRLRVERRLVDMPMPDADSVEIAVYFADTRVNLYQIRQWYEPLKELSKQHRVVLISRSPGTALTLWDEAPLPTLYLRKISELERFVHDQRQLKLVFYVNQNAKNFQMFRFGRMWHVFISHGESDKAYMSSNQYKAYDFAFVAGQAALDRLRRALWDYDVDERALVIGRPQVDHLRAQPPYSADDRTVVLYSPTWEGDRGSMRYGSVASHGEALVGALLASGRHRVVYRPHPRSGVADPSYGEANKRVIAAIEAANAADPAAGHIHDTSGSLDWQLSATDVAITDVSAMIYDRLATGKPIIVTRPASSDAVVDASGFLGSCEWLDVEDAGNVVEAVDRVQTSSESLATLQRWSEHHFGDTTPGASTQRFHGAVERLIEHWQVHAKLHADQEALVGAFDDEEADEDEAPVDES